MVRAVSSAGRASLYAQDTAEVWVVLITIEHADLPAPIRICNNTEDVVSDGETFTAWGFSPVLPAETDGELPAIELALDNVDRTFTTALRAITSPITLTEQVVRASDPDDVEAEFVFESRVIHYEGTSVRIELASESLLIEAFPGDLYTRTTNPGLFEGVAT